MSSTTSTREQDPIWNVENSASFASIHVMLPPGNAVNCESDAVVTFSQGVEVRGVMSGGILASLARAFFTQESFFTTIVENTNRHRVADVMMAPSNPGGVVLHKLTGNRDDLLLTSGAYIASDTNVRVTSEVQTRLGNSLLSGTGFFLLRSSGNGYVACGAYGAVHKYVLNAGEVRAVDNGHLLAWSASMYYRVGLASHGGIMNSVTSGEGLMCFFEGPGVVYLQSHKPDSLSSSGSQTKRGRGESSSAASSIVGVVFVLFFFLIMFLVIFSQVGHQFVKTNSGGYQSNDDYGDGYQQRSRNTYRKTIRDTEDYQYGREF